MVNWMLGPMNFCLLCRTCLFLCSMLFSCQNIPQIPDFVVNSVAAFDWISSIFAQPRLHTSRHIKDTGLIDVRIWLNEHQSGDRDSDCAAAVLSKGSSKAHHDDRMSQHDVSHIFSSSKWLVATEIPYCSLLLLLMWLIVWLIGMLSHGRSGRVQMRRRNNRCLQLGKTTSI